MNYEVDYCIYNMDFKCMLNKTNINALGMCEECTIISLDRGFLEAEKVRQLREIKHRWADKTQE